MARHLHRDVFANYVAGTLGEEMSRAVELHVSKCSTCAALLQEEAALEAAMFDAADPALRQPAPARRGDRSTRFAVANLAMAAAVLFAVFDPTGRIAMTDVREAATVAVASDSLGEGPACLPPTLDDVGSCEEPPLVAASYPAIVDEEQLFTVDPLVTEPEPACASQADGGVECFDT